MTRIVTSAVVRDDRTMTVQLPDEIEPGEHRVIVLMNGTDSTLPTPPDEASPAASEEQLVWKNGILVFTGKLPADFDVIGVIVEERNLRLRQLVGEEPE